MLEHFVYIMLNKNQITQPG